MGPAIRAVIRTAILLMVCACAGLLHGAPRRHIMYLRVDPGVLDRRLATFPTGAAQQMQTIEHQFDQIGFGKGLCKPQDTPKGLVCTVPGQTSAVVLVVTFLPKAGKHREIQVENAPLVLLPLLAESAFGVESKSTHIFAALDSDPDDQAALRGLIDRIQGVGQRTVSAVLLVSQVGRADPIVACAKRRSPLQQALAGTASTMGVPIMSESSLPCPSVLKGLDATFSDKRVLITSPGSKPAPNPAGFGYISQELTALDPKAYYTTYQYLCTLLAYLDSPLHDGSPAKSASTRGDEDITAELRACFEQARAVRGLPAFSSSEPLNAFAQQRTAKLVAGADAAASEPQSDLDQQLQAVGFTAQDASETVNSVAESDRSQLCDTLLRNRLLASPGPVALAVTAQASKQRIVAVAELAIPAELPDMPALKRDVLDQIDKARSAVGRPVLRSIDSSYIDSVACEVSALREPSLGPVQARLKREHQSGHIVVFRGRSAAIPDEQLVTLRESTDDQVSVGACRSSSNGEASVVVVTSRHE